MSNILIIGAGSMGTAFSFPCSDNGHSVTIIGTHLENDFIDQINLKKKHPTLESEVPKNVKFFKFDKLSEEINKKVDLIVVAVIAKGIEWVSIKLSKVLKSNIPILILTKGLAINNNNYEVLAHKMDRLLKKNAVKETNILAAGGPCLAKGLANRVHTSVVFANIDIHNAIKFSKLLSTDYYHIHVSNDVIGVEICAAIKNIFSMAIGASEGLCNTTISTQMKEKNFPYPYNENDWMKRVLHFGGGTDANQAASFMNNLNSYKAIIEDIAERHKKKSTCFNWYNCR